jgi:KaiC/GvpD/RAD55 family RecA-like ATPase
MTTTENHPTNGMLEAALYYASERDWHVFPCRADKTPYTQHGCLDATRDPDTIKKWWEEFPNANIGWNPGLSDHAVIDCDPGWDADELREKIGNFDDTTFRTRTPRGGEHFIVSIKSGETVAPSAGKIAAHVDVRSFNSYVLLPPSKTTVGDYVWDVDIQDTPRIRAAHRSEQFIDASMAARTKSVDSDNWIIDPDLPANIALAIDWLSNDAQIAVQGLNGDTMAFATAAHLKGLGISEASAIDLLWEYWNPRCEPPWSAGDLDHLRQKVTNAYEYNTSPPGNLTSAYKTAKIAALFSPVARDTDGKDTSNFFGRFRFADRTEISKIRPPQWLIKDFIPKDAFVLMFGAPGSYKTFVALDIALSIATGSIEITSERATWQHVKSPGSVLFAAGEGRSGIAKRIQAWEKLHFQGNKAQNFFLVDPVPNVTEELSDFIKGAKASSPEGYELVIIDTVSKAMQGVNENSQEHASNFTRMVETIQRELGATVLALHHTGKDNQSTPRGSSVYQADADTVLKLERTMDYLVALKMIKQKDAPEWDQPQNIKLEQVTLALKSGSLVAVRANEFDFTDNNANLPTADDIEARYRTVSDVVIQILKDDPSKKWSTNALAAKLAKDDRIDVRSSQLRQKYLPYLSKDNDREVSNYFDPVERKWRYQKA